MCACTGKNEWSWLAAMPMPSATPATNQTTASRTNQLAMPCMECSSNKLEARNIFRMRGCALEGRHGGGSAAAVPAGGEQTVRVVLPARALADRLEHARLRLVGD